MRDFILRELDRVGLGHNTFTQPAIDLVVRSADGVLRKARNLCVRCMIEAVRSANKTIDIDNVNRMPYPRPERASLAFTYFTDHCNSPAQSSNHALR
jgi:hypothetical protein